MKIIRKKEDFILSVQEAAELKGVGVLYLKAQLKKGVEWGEALNYSGKRWNYKIFTTKFLEHLGIPYRIEVDEC